MKEQVTNNPIEVAVLNIGQPKHIRRLLFLYCLLLGVHFSSSWAQSPSTSKVPWWEGAAIYQIYPRSFYDSNGDGIGDLNGITAKLDYLQSLGIDAIWLNPVYSSPQIDTGYDISNYTSIDPQYGTLADFDRLVREAKKRHIRVLMDMVLTHTSDKNPWFVESSSSTANPKADWYIWADGKNGNPPNNWLSFDSSTKSAWQYVPARGQYYYHIYDRRQPALNWRSPEVKKAMFNVIRFWLNRGVAGFRLDSAAFLYVDAQLRNNVYSTPATWEDITFGANTWNLPEYHSAMRELNTLLASYSGEPVLIGETDSNSMQTLRTMYGTHNDEIQLPMDFALFDTKFSAPGYRRAIGQWEQTDVGGCPLLFFSNHDFPRSYNRLGDGVHNEEIAKVVATLLLTVRGTPIIYNGEELGLATDSADHIKAGMEKSGRLTQPPFDQRDGERTPMQWNARTTAGFTTGDPWLPVEPDYKVRNVDRESADPSSLLSVYRSLLHLRRIKPALRTGDYIPLNSNDLSVLSYVRRGVGKEPSILVTLNMGDEARTVRFDNENTEIHNSSRLKPLFVQAAKVTTKNSTTIILAPYGIFVGELM